MRGKRSIALASVLLAVQLFSTALPTLAAGAEKSVEREDKSYSSEQSCECAALRDDVEVSSRFLELLFGKKKKHEAHINKEEKQEGKTELTLCPGGDVFGIKIAKDGVSVASVSEECGLKYGDIIISIGGKRIRSLSDVKAVLEGSDGSPLDLVIERGGSKVEAKIIPKKSDGTYTLGATLKDGVAGIGTVTYFNPKTGEFGGLGHAICEPKTAEPVKMKKGSVNGVLLGGVDKSEAGDPGELTGLLTEDVLGELYSNTKEGVFGKFNTPPDLSRKALPVGKKSDVREGEAVIYSTVKNGHRDEYKVEIFDIDRTSDGPKSFKVRVTDEALKALTGGIVRGMSGSPIIQDGKLVGAVTHVMVANPTEGYGIFIENMLNAAQGQVQPKAA
ncbi:MAG: SpoIVB peptidase [Clostridia bacterium]|nr:SpoIVB peptidase [Clostridia bacterium]MBR3715455.1 SpoIVB peptidase [Clostridia bacterium]